MPFLKKEHLKDGLQALIIGLYSGLAATWLVAPDTGIHWSLGSGMTLLAAAVITPFAVAAIDYATEKTFRPGNPPHSQIDDRSSTNKLPNREIPSDSDGNSVRLIARRGRNRR